jgi:hypothetical protein
MSVQSYALEEILQQFRTYLKPDANGVQTGLLYAYCTLVNVGCGRLGRIAQPEEAPSSVHQMIGSILILWTASLEDASEI